MKTRTQEKKTESLVFRTLERPTLPFNKNNNEKQRDIQGGTQYKHTAKTTSGSPLIVRTLANGK
jgi:hypothetical protein